MSTRGGGRIIGGVGMHCHNKGLHTWGGGLTIPLESSENASFAHESSTDGDMASLGADSGVEGTWGSGVGSGSERLGDRKHLNVGGVAGDIQAVGGALRDFDNFTVLNNSNWDNFGEPHTLSNSERQSKIFCCC